MLMPKFKQQILPPQIQWILITATPLTSIDFGPKLLWIRLNFLKFHLCHFIFKVDNTRDRYKLISHPSSRFHTDLCFCTCMQFVDIRKPDSTSASHRWGTCACPCQCQRTWRLRTGRSWCWPVPQRSACHAAHQQTPSYWGPNAGQGSAHSYCRRSPKESPAPVTDKGPQESLDKLCFLC